MTEFVLILLAITAPTFVIGGLVEWYFAVQDRKADERARLAQRVSDMTRPR